MAKQKKKLNFLLTESELKAQIDEKFLFRRCLIIPLENYRGIITSICANNRGFEFQVRYYIDGEQKTEWFYDFEIEVINVL